MGRKCDMETIAISARKRNEIIFTCTKYFFLVLVSIIFVFPIYLLIINSLIPYEDLTVTTLFPKRFTFEPYQGILTVKYFRYLCNTLFVCFMNVSGVCIASSLTAFAIAKLDFFGKNFIFACIMGMVLLPGTVLSIPLMIIYQQLGWTESLKPLWVPMWFGGGTMNIFLVRQFMRGVPKSYSEAAQLDGANPFQIYYMIILPLVKPILIYLAVTGFIGTWNDFQGPLTYVRTNEKLWTLSLALYLDFTIIDSISDANNLPNNQMAMGVLMMIPCLVLFAFFQKSIMEGISAIGIKG